MRLLEGKTALITGASRGIGKAIAKRFAAEGASIAITNIAEDEAFLNTIHELKAHNVTVKGYISNAADFEDSQKVVNEIVKDFGKIDILVNNAGITRDTLLMRIDSVEYTDGESRFYCSFIKNNIIERGQIRKRDTVIYYFPVLNYAIADFSLGIPFGVDSFFINRVNGVDTVRVLSYEKEYELFGKKYEVFHIKSSMIDVVSSTKGTNDMRVSPDIGIISNDSYCS